VPTPLPGGVKIGGLSPPRAYNPSACYWTKNAFVAQVIPNSIGARVLFVFGPPSGRGVK
jgi:hypothetical protein